MKEYVITIHGIATKGTWQEQIGTAFAPHFDCLPVKYPQYRWLGALKLLQEPIILFPTIVGVLALRQWLPGPIRTVGWLFIGALVFLAYLATYYRRTRAFNRMLEQASPHTSRALQTRTHLIAHSFGTYLTGRALQERPDFYVGRVVFIGCVLPREFPWATLQAPSVGDGRKFLEVRNELARRDLVVCAAWLMSPLIRGLGIAGFSGFTDSSGQIHDLSNPNTTCTSCILAPVSIHNVHSEYLGHSGTFVTSGYAETYWLPFLWGIEPTEYHQFLKYCNAAAALERDWSPASRQRGHVDPRLVRVERQLHTQKWRWTGGTFGSFVEQEVMSRFPGTPESLRDSVALAIRGTWDSVRQALDAYQARAVRARDKLPPDLRADAAIAWLNPHRAVRRAVNELPR